MAKPGCASSSDITALADDEMAVLAASGHRQETKSHEGIGFCHHVDAEDGALARHGSRTTHAGCCKGCAYVTPVAIKPIMAAARCLHTGAITSRRARRCFSTRTQDDHGGLTDWRDHCVFPARTFLHLETGAWLHLLPAQRT